MTPSTVEQTPADALSERRERLAGIEERIPELDAAIQEVNAQIAAAIAGGSDAKPLHEKRRSLRDELEDLEAAVPELRRLVQEAEEAVKAERQAEAQQRVERLLDEGPPAVQRWREAARETRQAMAAIQDLARSFRGANLKANGGKPGMDEYLSRIVGSDGHRVARIFDELTGTLDELLGYLPNPND